MNKGQASFDKLSFLTPSNSSHIPSIVFSTNYSSHPNSPKLLSPFSNAQPRRLSMYPNFRPHYKQSKTEVITSQDPCNKPENEEQNPIWSDNTGKSPRVDGRRLSKTSSLPVTKILNAPHMQQMPSFIRPDGSSLTLTPLSPIKGPVNFEEMLLMDNNILEPETRIKGNDNLSMIPEKGKPFINSIKKHIEGLRSRGSSSNTESSLNSFEKDFVGISSDSGSDDESNASNSPRSFNGKNSRRRLKEQADTGRILSSHKTTASQRVPLTSMIRRKSCYCSDCGNLSTFEKKHQNLANPCPREILNRINEALLKESLKQKSMKSLSSRKSLGDDKEEIIENHENVTEEKTEASPKETTCIENHEIESSFRSRIRTEGDTQALAKINDKQKGSFSPSIFKKLKNSPTSSKKEEIESKKGESARSPKNFVLKSLKDTVNPENAKKKGFLSPIFSPKSTEKSINISTSTLKIDSPNKTTSQRLSFLTSSLEDNTFSPLKVFPVGQRLKNMEDSRDSKDSKEEKANKNVHLKQNTLSNFFKRKVSEDVPKSKISDFGFVKRKSSDFDSSKLQKTESNPSKSYWGDQDKLQALPKKLRSTAKKKSIQGIYRNTSGNFSPKLPSLQNSPVSKMLDGLISPKKTSPRPIINIISVNDTESKLGKSPISGSYDTPVGSIDFKEGERSPVRKPSITTLDLLAINTTKHRKSFFGITSPKVYTAKDKPIKTETDCVEREEGTWTSTKKKLEESTTKKRSGKVRNKSKRSLSLEKTLKAYQLLQGKGTVQGKK